MSKTVTLTDEERQDITVALNMRRCYIETGTISLRGSDVQNMGNNAPPEAKIKALSPSQMETLLRMDELLRKLYS